MKRWLLQISTLVVATVVASAAHAQVNLSWDDCSTFGVPDKVFACNANTGSAGTLFGTFIAPVADHAVAIEGVIDMIEANSTLQPWWQFNTGECRPGAFALGANFSVSGPFNCVDYWAGQGIIVGGTVSNGSGKGVNTLRFKIACALPAEQAMTAGDEIYGFTISILKAKTIGTGSCAGCSDPACFVLNSILVNQTGGTGDVLLTGAPTGGRDFVTWQGGAGATCATVPAKNRTWGQVKSLYR